jgi:hypothetical protein
LHPYTGYTLPGDVRRVELSAPCCKAQLAGTVVTKNREQEANKTSGRSADDAVEGLDVQHARRCEMFG